MEDEVHFLFQCPQYNLLRNEYNIPFINIYDFNNNDFINPAVMHVHDAKLVCKFIKEAMFLREHPSDSRSKLIFTLHYLSLLVVTYYYYYYQRCVHVFVFTTMYEYFNNYFITKCLLSCDVLLMLNGSRQYTVLFPLKY